MASENENVPPQASSSDEGQDEGLIGDTLEADNVRSIKILVTTKRN
jgi:hypothetical protein